MTGTHWPASGKPGETNSGSTGGSARTWVPQRAGVFEGVAERSNAGDCKSLGATHVGSNPTPFTKDGYSARVAGTGLKPEGRLGAGVRVLSHLPDTCQGVVSLIRFTPPEPDSPEMRRAGAGPMVSSRSCASLGHAGGVAPVTGSECRQLARCAAFGQNAQRLYRSPRGHFWEQNDRPFQATRIWSTDCRHIPRSHRPFLHNRKTKAGPVQPALVLERGNLPFHCLRI